MFKPLNGKCVFCKCLQHMNYTPALKNAFSCVILQMKFHQNTVRTEAKERSEKAR